MTDMPLKTTRWDSADYLKTAEARAAYLDAALEEGDPAFFQHALGIVARAQGMQDVATKADASRAGLYKALSSTGNPEFTTVYRVIDALGYRLTLARKKKGGRPARKSAAGHTAPAPARSKTRAVTQR